MSLSDAAYERLTMARNDFKIFHELFGGILDIPDTLPSSFKSDGPVPVRYIKALPVHRRRPGRTRRRRPDRTNHNSANSAKGKLFEREVEDTLVRLGWAVIARHDRRAMAPRSTS